MFFKYKFYGAKNNKLQGLGDWRCKYLFTIWLDCAPGKYFVKLCNTCSLKKFQSVTGWNLATFYCTWNILKKTEPRSLSISNIIDSGFVFETLIQSMCQPFQSQNCWNLQKSIVVLLFHHLWPNWVRKSHF